ncbi:MAG: YfiR family protein [Mangrovibacterium sp.]|nr:YfiR family protein [Mangrovibacterium sp.]
MKRRIHTALVLLLLLVQCSPAFGLTAGVDEYLLKAVFFERFTRFIDFGYNTAVRDSFFVITVFGENPFGDRLEQVYRDQRILNRKVKVTYTGQVDQVGTPDMLYIGKDKKEELGALFQSLHGYPTITIADSPSLSGSGVMINLLVIGDKIRFEIDLEAAGEKNIKFDRVLLVNAMIVKHEKTK